MGYDTRELQVKITGDSSDLNKTLNSTSKAVDETGKATQNSFLKTGAVMGAVAGIAQNVFSRAIDGISSSVGDAIKRVDTLNNANNIFADMGFKAADTKVAMDNLKTSILGLPTSLDQAVSGVELLAGSTNDIGKSQKIFSAMNDAILGFGGSADAVQGAIVQLSQAFSNGKVDAQTWNSLIQNGMGPALNAIAKQMGITTGALKDGLSTGTISVQAFQDALIKMDTEGGGGMKSFKETSKDATSGIASGMANAKTAVTRGIADIIQAIGSKNISDAISRIGTAFENALKATSKAITDAIEVMKKIIKFTKDHEKVIKEVATAITIFLLPALVQAGKQALIAAAKSVKASVMSSTAWIRSAVMTSASFFAEMAKVIASFALTAAKATSEAAVSSAKWVASAVAASAAWIAEMGKTVAVMALTAVKAAPHAADASLAWIINAARVSFVWVTQEMPKLIVSFVATAASATVQAAVTSATWIANAVKTSVAWVVTELPKIILGFIATSASASTSALATSAAWIASASKSAVAWVITELPKIIAGFVAMAASAVLNATITSAAWVAAAARSSAAWVTSIVVTSESFGALSLLVATPLVMPAIAVGAALASIGLVFDKAIQTKNLIDEVKGDIAANKAADAQAIAQMQAQYYLSSDPAVRARSKTVLHGLGVPGFATGTLNAPGGMALVGEQGPELVNLPKGSQVISNDQMKSAQPNLIFNVNVGMYAGMPVEKRQIALELYKELVRAARAQGTQLQMIGAIPVQ